MGAEGEQLRGRTSRKAERSQREFTRPNSRHICANSLFRFFQDCLGWTTLISVLPALQSTHTLPVKHPRVTEVRSAKTAEAAGAHRGPWRPSGAAGAASPPPSIQGRPGVKDTEWTALGAAPNRKCTAADGLRPPFLRSSGGQLGVRPAASQKSPPQDRAQAPTAPRGPSFLPPHPRECLPQIDEGRLSHAHLALCSPKTKHLLTQPLNKRNTEWSGKLRSSQGEAPPPTPHGSHWLEPAPRLRVSTPLPNLLRTHRAVTVQKARC